MRVDTQYTMTIEATDDDVVTLVKALDSEVTGNANESPWSKRCRELRDVLNASLPQASRPTLRLDPEGFPVPRSDPTDEPADVPESAAGGGCLHADCQSEAVGGLMFCAAHGRSSAPVEAPADAK